MRTRSKWQSLPTEAINPKTLSMDQASTEEIIDLMLQEDRKTIIAVQREKERIAIGAELITQAFRTGGRLVFVGAGTSGRLGVLEAAEMLPTFGTPPRLVQAVMAGGRDAFFKPREGVEDNFEEGGRAVGRLRLTSKDLKQFGIVDSVVPEPPGGAHRSPDEMIETLKEHILAALSEFDGIDADSLVERRYARLRALGEVESADG